RARQAKQRLAAGEDWTDTGRIFTNQRGGYLNGSWVTHAFQQQLERAGLPRMTFHQLRHANATLLLGAGASMRTVMEQLGHSQINVTMDLYTHVTSDALRDAAG